MNELGELTTQLLARFGRGINFLLDHRLRARSADSATLICDQAARRLLRDGHTEAGESAWAAAVRQSLADYIADCDGGTDSARGAMADKKPNSRAIVSLLEKLEELDRQVLLRYYRSNQDKSVICCDLELSDYHFNQILARAKYRYTSAPTAVGDKFDITVSPFGDRLDRYLLNQSTEQESRDAEIALLEKPAIIQEAEATKKLINDLRNARLPRRWRLADEPRSDSRAKGRLRRRRRGIWRFLTRPCLGAAASILCVIGVIGSWIVWDMQQINSATTRPASANIVPLRIAQTRGSRPSTFLQLPSDMHVVDVTLDIGTPQNDQYRISLLGTDGQLLFEQGGIVPDEDDLLRFPVASNILTDGVHRFVVEPSHGPGHRIQLAFQVETATDST